ncbi:MAG TPA: glycosyltransferase family 39 protein [Gemmataceae bacterium]|nr:glycosyltransferase family 39 protein [Gemmataceae bacterium]
MAGLLSRRNPSRWTIGLLAAAVLAAHGALLVWEAWGDSPTWDEVAHLPTGVRYWETGQFDLYRVNPPLVRLVAALPVWVSRPRTSYWCVDAAPYNRSEFAVAQDFVRLNGPRSLWLYRLGRLACVPFSLLGAWTCFAWGRLLYGRPAGLLALTLWCFDPLVLGHGHLITCDVAGAATALASGYTFWLWLQKPGGLRALVAGLSLGLAELTKTTNLLLFGIWPCAWLLWRFPPWRFPAARWAAEGAQLLTALLVALVVLNAGYGFEGTFDRLGDYQFVSETFCGSGPNTAPGRVTWNRFVGTWLQDVPVPLPANYLSGIDTQKKELEARLIVSQLRGVVRHGGWWYYYLYALLVKEPLGTLALVALAAAVPWFFPRPPGAGRNESLLLLPLLGFLVALSSQTGFTCHARYALPVLPFAFVLAGRIVPAAASWRLLAGAVLVCVLATVGSSLRICPHSLSYFNEAAGGPSNGHRHLLDSNLDWGQDLLYLRRWYEQHPEARPLGLAYNGTFDTALVIPGLKSVPRGPSQWAGDAAETGPRPGWYAVSVHFVYGGNRPPDPDWPNRDYLYFQHCIPVARAGYSIWIYHLTPQEADRVRRLIGLAPLPAPETPAGGS